MLYIQTVHVFIHLLWFLKDTSKGFDVMPLNIFIQFLPLTTKYICIYINRRIIQKIICLLEAIVQLREWNFCVCLRLQLELIKMLREPCMVINSIFTKMVFTWFHVQKAVEGSHKLYSSSWNNHANSWHFHDHKKSPSLGGLLDAQRCSFTWTSHSLQQ